MLLSDIINVYKKIILFMRKFSKKFRKIFEKRVFFFVMFIDTGLFYTKQRTTPEKK